MNRNFITDFLLYCFNYVIMISRKEIIKISWFSFKAPSEGIFNFS